MPTELPPPPDLSGSRIRPGFFALTMKDEAPVAMCTRCIERFSYSSDLATVLLAAYNHNCPYDA